MKTIRLSLFALVLLLFGCAYAQAQSEKEMNELGSALTKVSSAVEGTVHFEKKGLDLQDMALLTLATQHDPGLLDPFRRYALRAKAEGGHSAVLVCTADGRLALLEDTGCTARMDQHLWQVHPPLPCDFTLDLAKVCP